MSKNIVFTSAGDNSNFIKWWCSDKQNYDIYVMYYGDNMAQYTEYAKHTQFLEMRKGSKFQNFNFFYNKYSDIIERYDRFFILDDDIEITSEDINRMFTISETHNLLICAPSFKHDSKISHPITVHKPHTLLTYTNFVEVNTPLFRKDALVKYMKYYNPCLIGYGIDYLYIWANGCNKTDSYAIIHAITCRNPHDSEKKGKRELALIANFTKRAAIWKEYAAKIKSPYHFHHKVYKQIPL